MNEKAQNSKDYKSFVQNTLKKDETVLDVTIGFIGEMMGEKEDRQYNGVLICTNQRVVFHSKGWFSEVNRSIPLEKVSSIDLDKGLLFQSIKIHTSNDGIYVRSALKFEELQRFQKNIEEARDAKNLNSEENLQNNNSLAEDDPIAKIKKLSELKEQGIISDEEFNQKKKELMDQI
jgi:hypothetical protein